MELRDYPVDLGKYHSSEFPIVLRYMTDEEMEKKPDSAGFARNFPRRGSRVIALLRRESKLKESSTLVHELGHISYPVFKASQQPRRYLDFNFSELCANYHQLKQYKGVDRNWVKQKIRNIREELRSEELWESQIARLEKLAMHRVGYRGRRVD